VRRQGQRPATSQPRASPESARGVALGPAPPTMTPSPNGARQGPRRLGGRLETDRRSRCAAPSGLVGSVDGLTQGDARSLRSCGRPRLACPGLACLGPLALPTTKANV